MDRPPGSPPVLGEVTCVHCGKVGKTVNGKVPQGWRAPAISHFDCPDCFDRCDLIPPHRR